MQAWLPCWRWLCLGLADWVWLGQPQLASLPMRGRNVVARLFAPLPFFEPTHQLGAGPSERPCETAE
jgi:hypothetical protein